MPKTTNKRKKVLIALSGGIDSAVSAWLLQKRGYEVEAAFMKNWSDTAGLKYSECPWLQDRQDAIRVAAFLRIPLHTLDFEKEYASRVMKYFFAEYKAGRTPNPDVMCNKEIKFKLLYDWAIKNGFESLATGHYAQIKSMSKARVAQYESNPEAGKLSLAKAVDGFKDQTYFIYNLSAEKLNNLIFPIGGYKKSEVKKLAKKIGLPNAEKKESMGLCFVGQIRLKDFLAQKLKPKKGKILDSSGKVLGTHNGLHNFTIGQRQGIGIGGSAGPWFVVEKRLVDNFLIVTNNPNDKLLKTKQIQIHSLNWIRKPKKFPVKLEARFRHQGQLVKCTLSPASFKNKKTSKDIVYEVKFDKAQTAIASGQSLVLYSGDFCLGGGIIV